MKDNPLTKHHRVCESWGGTLRPNNILMLRQRTHQALHTVFENDTPIQRLRRSLEADKPAIRPEVYRALSKTLSRFEGVMEVEAYEKDCLNPDKFLQRLSQL